MRLLLLSLLVACAVPPSAPPSKVWATPAMWAAGPGKDFGGFDPGRLVAKQGASVAWRGVEYTGADERASADALVVQPGYFDGASVAYVVTEIWVNHPDPWVEPVYAFVDEFVAAAPGSRVPLAPNLFGVGTDSTFYSPYWRLWWAVPPAGTVPPYTQVAQVTGFDMHLGPIVVCPIVKQDMGFSASAHPLTGVALKEAAKRAAYVNGVLTPYVDLGPNRQLANVYEEGFDGTVTAADLYVFARLEADGARTLLELPAVLPQDALHHAFVRRVDVVLDRQAVFVPAGMTALRDRLLAEGLNVPPADPTIPAAAASARLLAVASDSSCFSSAPAFPAGCAWLDSEAAIEQRVATNRIIATDVTLTATVVPFK